jgi:LAO/AO transport system kinase
MGDADKLIEETLNGEKLSIARLISMVERGDEQAPYIMEKIYPHSGNAYYIGVTGPPGAGKSTTVDRLVKMFCENGFSVGVVAVDPSSPFTGGSLLGDRIRMTIKPKKKWDVFFRSMSAGRVMGGLARTTKEASRILDASGKQIIIIETVGVGQSELDIAQATDTVMVIVVPESGDSIQIMKAGLMEIADIFVINKADRPGVENILQAVEGMLERSIEVQQMLDESKRKPMDWKHPIFLTSAAFNKGIAELYEGIWDHHRHLQEKLRLQNRRKLQLKNELRHRVQIEFSEALWGNVISGNNIEKIVEEVWQTKVDPQAAARKIVTDWIQKQSGKADKQ